MTKGILFIILVQSILFANNTYYEHKVSQFKLLSTKADKPIIMLGDSITDWGLWNELVNRIDIANRGIVGDTTKGVLNRLDILNKNTKQVFIMIGINDLIRGKSVDYVFTNYKKIITILRRKNITPIIQSTLFIGGNIPLIYNQKVEKLNDLLYKYAKNNKIEFIDLNKKLAPNKILLKKYTFDGLHLNGQAYLEWAKLIEKYLGTNLK